MTKIDLITGILGTGKTTFLLRYAKSCLARGEKIAVLENDFGAVNIDMLLLQELKCDNCQLEMVSGCTDPFCHRRRFRTQLIALGMQHFDRIIVEPSGIFDMDEFFDLLYESPLDRWYEIGSILTVTDAKIRPDMSAETEYLLASEAACCGKLILSKIGAEEPESTVRANAEQVRTRLNAALEKIRCNRRFTETDLLVKNWDALTSSDFEALSAAGYRNENYVKQFRTEALQSTVHYFMRFRIPDGKIGGMVREILQDPECGEVQRIKGSFCAEDGTWYKLNSVNGNLEIAPVPEGQAVLIFIGEHLSLPAIDAHIRAYNTADDYVCI
ncbi:MAG: GTPase (G3E family) [Oscillospiraceae bacterium]|nr:GTPase (G3E family) [Oscillospiraceae bacterium]